MNVFAGPTPIFSEAGRMDERLIERMDVSSKAMHGSGSAEATRTWYVPARRKIQNYQLGLGCLQQSLVLVKIVNRLNGHIVSIMNVSKL